MPAPETPNPPDDGLNQKQVDQVKKLVDSGVQQAKLTVTESRLNHVLVLAGIMFALFGVLLPWWTTKTSTEQITKAAFEASEKTDKAIDQMKQQFKDLAGTALRKPDLNCFIDGQKLDNQVVKFSPSRPQNHIELINVGDAPAKNIQVRLYTNFEISRNQSMRLSGGEVEWQSVAANDEPHYTHAYELVEYQGSHGLASIDVKNPASIWLAPWIPDGVFRTNTSPALLKIFYEQPEPKRVMFTLSVSDKD